MLQKCIYNMKIYKISEEDLVYIESFSTGNLAHGTLILACENRR